MKERSRLNSVNFNGDGLLSIDPSPLVQFRTHLFHLLTALLLIATALLLASAAFKSAAIRICISVQFRSLFSNRTIDFLSWHSVAKLSTFSKY